MSKCFDIKILVFINEANSPKLGSLAYTLFMNISPLKQRNRAVITDSLETEKHRNLKWAFIEIGCLPVGVRMTARLKGPYAGSAV